MRGSWGEVEIDFSAFDIILVSSAARFCRASELEALDRSDCAGDMSFELGGEDLLLASPLGTDLVAELTRDLVWLAFVSQGRIGGVKVFRGESMLLFRCKSDSVACSWVMGVCCSPACGLPSGVSDAEVQDSLSACSVFASPSEFDENYKKSTFGSRKSAIKRSY